MVKFQSLEQSDYQPLEYKTTQQNILQSDSVAESVIEELELAANPEMTGELKQRGFMAGVKQLVVPLLKKPAGRWSRVGGERREPGTGGDAGAV